MLLTGRDAARAEAVAADVGGDTRGLALDLAEPERVADALSDVGPVDHARPLRHRPGREHRPGLRHRLRPLPRGDEARRLHGRGSALLDRLAEDGSVLLFGGRAKDRPYPGSTTVSTVNGGVTGLVNTLAVQIAPRRVNALHPGIVADSPFWEGKTAATDAVRDHTPTGRNVAMEDIVDAVDFLIRNRSVNGIDLYVDGGWLLQ